jgi:S-adenosylmethionine:tRNA ribosyltransferase-isomerase
MIPATAPSQRPADAKLLVVDASGHFAEDVRRNLRRYLRNGDLVIANDAATLPASLRGVHQPTWAEIEIRLAARHSLAPDDVSEFTAVVFGPGDFHTRTEDRPLPPLMASGDTLLLGPLRATVLSVLGHPRLISLGFDGPADAIWTGLAQHGRPIQYAHLHEPLALWDVWTVVAGRPAAFEPPSAGFVLDWDTLAALHASGIEFATITHAAGISSTGDPALDALLPLDEAYEIPPATARAIERARSERRRIVAIGTTVVRTLEQAASRDGRVREGGGTTTVRIGPSTRLRVVDAIISGVHEPDTSHYQLLRAFASDNVLRSADELMERHGYRTHEFGDSVLIELTARESRRDPTRDQDVGMAASSSGVQSATHLPSR